MLAAQWAGIENTWHSEIEKYPCKLLGQQFPKSKNHGDIKTIDWSAVKPVDIITGGFPCQPFSIAGKRGGQQDDRYLWPQMFEGIQALRPRWVIGENVPGIKSLALDEVLSDLESAGYTCQTLDIPACALNAPHARHRLWIIAYDSSEGLERSAREGVQESELRPSKSCNDGPTPDTNRQRSDNGRDSGGERRIQTDEHGQLPKAQPNGQRFEREFGAAGEAGTTPDPFSTRRQERHAAAFTDRQGFSRWQRDAVGYAWEAQPPICGVDDGIPDRRHRIKGLGNAIVPQIPYILFTYIQQIEAQL